jgi:hypothetical protein
MENCELNTESRSAKLAHQYQFNEHQFPWKVLGTLGIDKQLLFDNQYMGEMLKGRITSKALPTKTGKRKTWKKPASCLSKGRTIRYN